MHWEHQGQNNFNTTIGCPVHCSDLVQHCGVCSLCVRANFLNHEFTPAISLPIRLLAQINLINETLHGNQLVTNTYHLLGGSNWTEFLLAWVDLFGTEAINSIADSLATNLALILIVSLITLKVFSL